MAYLMRPLRVGHHLSVVTGSYVAAQRASPAPCGNSYVMPRKVSAGLRTPPLPTFSTGV
jgi:hypothetical protein